MINLIHLDKTNELPKVKDLYFEAFPKYERVPFWLLMYRSKKKNCDLYTIYEFEYHALFKAYYGRILSLIF